MPRPVANSEAGRGADTASGWLFLIGLLLAARYLQPTEAVTFGETLWQGQLWLVAAAVWCWRVSRGGEARLRVSLLDACLWLSVAGHALSTAVVFVEGGDRRAAVNVVWEWAGLAATWFLVRQVLGGDLRGPLRVFAAVIVSLAVLGIWQHHVSQPAAAAAYESLTEEEQTLARRMASGSATPSERLRLTEIRRALHEMGVPTEERSRKRWEDRLRYSSEALGTFALANTFGGLLAACVPVLAVLLLGTRRSPGRGAVLAAIMALVLYGLLLTRSRTAWAGLTVGTIAGVALYLVRGRLGRSAAAALLSVVGALLVAGLLAIAFGGGDAFSGAPKSLQYRLDYWRGTLAVLAERPVLGTGPANFRSHYLEHRPFGASEEIASPHNLFLDVWVAGGLVSLLALAAFAGIVGFRLLRGADSAIEADPLPRERGLEWGAAAAFPVVVAVYFIAGAGIDLRLLAIWPVAGAALFCLRRANAGTPLVVGAGAGFIALAVHLLGADGIEFPAVMQTLLLLAAAVDRPREVVAKACPAALPAIAFGGLAVGCLLMGLRPVLNSGALVARAERLIAAGDPGADRVLAEAAEADPLSLEPLVLRAELARSIEQARRRWETVRVLDPRNLSSRVRLAAVLMAEPEAGRAAEAAELLKQAVAVSPTDALLRARLAMALAAAGRSSAAAESAERALELDRANQRAMHLDQILEESLREELERLVDVGKGAGGT